MSPAANLSAEALRELAEALAQSLPRALAVDIAGSKNTVAGRDMHHVSARGRGVAVAGHYFEIHLHVSTAQQRTRGAQ